MGCDSLKIAVLFEHFVPYHLARLHGAVNQDGDGMSLRLSCLEIAKHTVGTNRLRMTSRREASEPCGLVLAGDGPLKQTLAGQVKSLGLEERVFFVALFNTPGYPSGIRVGACQYRRAMEAGR